MSPHRKIAIEMSHEGKNFFYWQDQKDLCQFIYMCNIPNYINLPKLYTHTSLSTNKLNDIKYV